MGKGRAGSVCDGRECKWAYSPENWSSARRPEIRRSCLLDAHGTAKLLGKNAAHELRQRLSRLLENKSPRGIRPGQLKTCRQCRNPNLAYWRVRADYKSCFVGIFEQDFEFPASALDFKAMLIAYLLKPPAQGFKRSITAFLKLF